MLAVIVPLLVDWHTVRELH